MNDSNQAYQLLASIGENDDLETVYQKAQAAYQCDNHCLEAIVLMSRCIKDLAIKENLLASAINQHHELSKGASYHRLVYEMAKFYQDHGKNKQAINMFNTLKALDINNEYHSDYYLATLYAIFEDHQIEALYQNYHADLKVLFPYLLYLFKQSRFDELFKNLQLLNDLNPYFKKVLAGEVNEDEENPDPLLEMALKVLRFNSLLVNACPGFISFVAGADI